MNYSLYDFAGNIGVVVVMVTYLYLQLGKLKSTSYRFSLFNAIGASLIMISLLDQFNLSAFVIEVFWLLISIVGLVRLSILKNDHT